jgi:hypothetical protein
MVVFCDPVIVLLFGLKQAPLTGGIGQKNSRRSCKPTGIFAAPSSF